MVWLVMVRTLVGRGLRGRAKAHPGEMRRRCAGERTACGSPARGGTPRPASGRPRSLRFWVNAGMAAQLAIALAVPAERCRATSTPR